ncbi:MAG: hypothetical protein HYV97_07950 [Bdellovibrio sp.]|nr:hypothetical protein [Bdellovibrio sp.]
MKKMLVSFSLLACTGQVFAGDCLQDICLRDTVIDNNDRIGVVSAIETSVSGSIIKFTESSSGYSYSSTYERLAKKVTSTRFPEGSFVLDASNHLGPVKMAFANGKVQLKEESTGYSYISNNATPEVAEYSGIAKNKYVIDANDRIGKTLHVFEKGQTQFREDSSGYNYIVAHATAEVDSLDGLAKGIVAIDSNKRVGVVQVIFGNRKASYQEPETRYTYISQNLSPEVTSLPNGTKAGMMVIDSNDRIGKAMHVFANGLGQYKETSTNYSYVSGDLNPEIGEFNGLKKDAFAIDSNNRVGKTVTVFKNGKAQYRDPDSGYTYISGNMSAEVAVLENGLKPGMIAIDGNDRIGRVLHTFANQKAQYKENSTGYNYIALSPSPEVPELGGLSMGVIAIDSNNRIGKVVYVFANKKAQFIENSTGYSYISSSLMNEVNEFESVSKNTRIIDPNNRIGITTYVFEDGRIQFKESVSGYSYITNRPSPEVANLGNLSADLIVLDENNRVGKIAYLFKNGSIVHKELSSGYQYIVSSVSPEVDSHDTYNKDDDYSTDSYWIGKVKRFFANKKMEFVAQGYSFIVSKLFLEVAEFQTYQRDQKIVDSSGDAGTVKKLFSNGAILYEAKKKLAGDDVAKLHTLSAKIFGANEKELESDQINWIKGLARALSEEGTYFDAYGIHPLVIKDEDYADLKVDLLDFLKKHDNVIFEQKLRKKVLKYLGESDSDVDLPTNNGDILSVKLLTDGHTATLVKLLERKKIKYQFSLGNEVKLPSLTVNVLKFKSTLFVHKCSVKMDFEKQNFGSHVNLTKNVWSLKKTPCEALVKKAFAALKF